jgi:hypothetical protein
MKHGPFSLMAERFLTSFQQKESRIMGNSMRLTKGRDGNKNSLEETKQERIINGKIQR